MVAIKHGVAFLVTLSALHSAAAFILIPEDIQSVLQLAYSFLPTVKLGIENTKLGVGFRLGKNADWQVLVELGPQTESSRRRQAMHPSVHRFPTASEETATEKFSNEIEPVDISPESITTASPEQGTEVAEKTE